MWPPRSWLEKVLNTLLLLLDRQPRLLKRLRRLAVLLVLVLCNVLCMLEVPMQRRVGRENCLMLLGEACLKPVSDAVCRLLRDAVAKTHEKCNR